MYVVTLGELAAPIVSQDRKHGCGASWGEMRRVESQGSDGAISVLLRVQTALDGGAEFWRGYKDN